MKSKNMPLVATMNKTASSKKKLLTSAVLLSIGGFVSSANADLSNGSLGLDVQGNLNPACLYDGTYPSCDYGAFDTADAGSYFLMDGNPGGAIDGDLGDPDPDGVPTRDFIHLMLDGSAQSFNGTPISLGNTYVGDNDGPIATWDFFGGLGTNTHAGITAGGGDTTIGMSTWEVNWGEVAVIDMGGDPNQGDTGIATLSCAGGTCEVGETFTLDYAAHVPIGDPSGFGGVAYALHLQGTIVSTNDAPVATSDPLLASVALNGTVMIDLASNVTDPDGPGVDNTSFLFTYTGTRIPAPTIIDNGSGVFSYTDNAGTETVTADTFEYTVADDLGDRSDVDQPFVVEVSVISGNIPPVAQSFTVGTDKDVAVVVNILENVTDTDGTVDPASVVPQNVFNGTITNIDSGTGEVTFLPLDGVIGAGSASFDYTVKDDSGDPSNIATVLVDINDPPVAGDATVSVDRNSEVIVDVVALTSDSDGSVDPTTVFATQGTNGTTSVDLGNGKVTYTPTTAGFLGTDEFTYTINDNNGATSLPGTITVNIVNALPIAVDDITSIDTSINASVDVDVTVNDTDSDGTIDTTTVVITAPPTNGNATVSGTGVITYTPAAGHVGSDTLQYTVDDNDGGTSNPATVVVSVSSGTTFCDKEPLAADQCFLQFVPGNVVANTLPVLGDGSYFSMEVQPGAPTFTAIEPFNSFQLNTAQLASSAIPIEPNIDQAWLFFGNLGVHQSTTVVTVLTDDGAGNATIDMSGWDVSWNTIPNIALGEGADNGIGTLKCFSDNVITQTQGDCSEGDAFVFDYHATVPPGDPSGFGNVKYALHMEGVIAVTGVVYSPAIPPDTTDIQAITANGELATVKPGSVAIAANNTTGTNLTAADTGVTDPLLNPADGRQCLGGCIDIVVTDLSGADYVDIIYHTSEALVDGAIYRKLMNGIWVTFDTSDQDQLGSNAEDAAGACTDDQFEPGLRSGNRCMFIRIYDGGPNDADHVKNGTIVDPGGALVAGSPNVPAASTSGCSISPVPVSLRDRADWILVVLFVGLLGAIKFRRKHIS